MVNANSVNSDSIVSTDISSNLIDTTSLYVNGQDIGLQVQQNSLKLTDITYDASNTTTVGNNLTVNDTLTCKNQFYIRDPTDPTNVYMRVYSDSPYYDFRFAFEAPGRYMYFSVKDAGGNYKLLQFNSSQMYSNIYFYEDNDFNVSYNKYSFFGDYGSLSGGGIKYIPSIQPHDGFVMINFNNGYYTNFSNRNLVGSDIQVLRLYYNVVTSLFDHLFNTNLTVTGTSTHNGSSIFNGTSTFSNTSTFNDDAYFNDTVNTYGQ